MVDKDKSIKVDLPPFLHSKVLKIQDLQDAMEKFNTEARISQIWDEDNQAWRKLSADKDGTIRRRIFAVRKSDWRNLILALDCMVQELLFRYGEKKEEGEKKTEKKKKKKNESPPLIVPDKIQEPREKKRKRPKMKKGKTPKKPKIEEVTETAVLFPPVLDDTPQKIPLPVTSAPPPPIKNDIQTPPSRIPTPPPPPILTPHQHKPPTPKPNWLIPSVRPEILKRKREEEKKKHEEEQKKKVSNPILDALQYATLVRELEQKENDQ